MEIKKKIFVRIGAIMTLTESEFNLLCEEIEPAAAMVKAKLDQGEYEINGETYFPGAIEEEDGIWFHGHDFDFIL